MIPIVDFASSPEVVARQAHDAYTRIGFMYAANLLSDANALEHTFSEARKFFDLPDEEKQACGWSSEASNRGYTAVEQENVDPDAPGDLKEAYNMGKEGNTEHPNPWPSSRPQFREAMVAFHETCLQMSFQVLAAFEQALELPPGFFKARHDVGDSNILRVLHYPAVSSLDTLKPGQLRAGAHTDYGTITLLMQDDVGGLEVRSREGEWIPAPMIPGTVIVNSGDLLARWTNDVFCSTPHRVVLPQTPEQNRSRQSLAFFCHPNFDAEVRCIESCARPDQPAKYPSIGAGEYLLWRLSQSY
ncbi:MAG: isopenicillin N synthase family dioxygenase [bacterium]|jgi:isopenicillin N synthase-like dioxygenase